MASSFFSLLEQVWSPFRARAKAFISHYIYQLCEIDCHLKACKLTQAQAKGTTSAQMR